MTAAAAEAATTEAVAAVAASAGPPPTMEFNAAGVVTTPAASFGGQPTMPTGHVKWFDNRRGWGYLRLDDGTEVFVHQRDIVGKGFSVLRSGERVTCELTDDERGTRATQVSVVR